MEQVLQLPVVQLRIERFEKEMRRLVKKSEKGCARLPPLSLLLHLFYSSNPIKIHPS